ncbi:GHMP kinase [Natrinema pellirubrum DSM 15624]|uniref:Pantoate kinase n=1 Tax=Natrinema pellirubrum (strain DSM 15624 / CIP 106293 / JCM 10476 / NCIMB 786 / 157) TaxID=797303 RepID=L0JHU8_NATP1|nr:pantoate kinase [Natrinema pellirubrum]AGB30864.1 putative kinase, sugar kinase superfamily [Natrinema pellirubrum DSM 15624]ELY80747.1 GHMP kinase [Natrinema pellirubrum DSM 15624]
MREEATAFVPGHVTGFFSTHPDDDPTKAGSRGAGLTLTDGVEVTVERAAETTVFLDDVEIEIEPVETVLETIDVSARIDATSELPIGSGFGVSGAMALGTALAANRVFGCKLSMNELVTIAHGAEVQAGTGLGDVVAQAHGGVPIRLEPGGPQDNKLDAVPARARVEYVTFGELSTADVLSGDTEQLTAAGQEALSRVVEEPTLLSFMYASRLFARDAELLTDRVRETIAEVSDADGQASMAMLGETVFALGTGLSDAGYEPSVCATHPAGAVLK